MSDKIFGFYKCDFLKLPDFTETGWEKSTKEEYLELIKESNFAILHKGDLEENDFDEAKSDAIFIRVSQGGQEDLRKKRGVYRPEKNVYCLHVWNQQPLENNSDDLKKAILTELLNLIPDKAKQILSGNLNGLDEKLKLLFSMPGNSDILCSWWMLCQAYFLYRNDTEKKALLEDKDAWKLGLPDDESAKDQVEKDDESAKDQDNIQSAKDQVEKDIDYMCNSRGITISKEGKNELVKVCKCFIDTVTGESVFDIITNDTLTELQEQLKKLFPTQGGLK